MTTRKHSTAKKLAPNQGIGDEGDASERPLRDSHVAPKSEGGADERQNLQPLCGRCHRAKTAQDARAARCVR